MTNISEKLEKLLEEVNTAMGSTPIEAISITTVSKSVEPEKKKKKEDEENGNTGEDK